jgi:protein-disulfide isomerase
MAQYPDGLRFVYRQFPVASLHPDAMLAAEASMCAAEQDKFLPYHDRLFLNQSALDETSLLTYARQVGADSQRFTTCFSGHRYKSVVERDIADGTALGVEGTPTWFINGHKIAGAIPKDLFQQVVDMLLTSTKQ